MMNQADPEEADHKEKLVKEFVLWDSYLAKTKYIATDEFSVAGNVLNAPFQRLNVSVVDIMLIPSVMFLTRFGMTFKDYPNLKRYYNMAKDRPSVVRTMPPHWRESQGPNFLSIF